jgi:hypothetical protein
LVEADHAVDLQALPPASARIAAVRCRSPLEVGGCCGQGVPTEREAAEREIPELLTWLVAGCATFP